MTFTNYGFDGSVDEFAFANLMRMAGVRKSVQTRSSFAATAVAGTRQVSLAIGTAYADGVLAYSDAASVLTIPAPQSGGWFLIVLRRDWDAGTVTPTVLTGDTSASTVPSTVPAAFPSTFKDAPGDVADQELYWVFATLNSTTLMLVDLRKLPLGVEKKGSTAQRDAFYGVPSATATRRALQGESWWNTDYGWEEHYFAMPYDDPSGINAAGAEYTAGWYPERVIIYNRFRSAVSANQGTTLVLTETPLEALPYPTLCILEFTGQAGFSVNNGISMDHGFTQNTPSSHTLYGERSPVHAPNGGRWYEVGTRSSIVVEAGETTTIQTTARSDDGNVYTRGNTKITRIPLVHTPYWQL